MSYEIIDEKVFCNGVYLRKADPKTFTMLNELFASDKSNVYVLGNVLKDADPKTFKVLPNQLTKLTVDGEEVTIGGGYGKDENNVYWYELTIGKGMKVKGADVSSFDFLSHEWGRDNKFVYHMGRKVIGAKADSFRAVGWLYGQDRNIGFYGNKKCHRKVIGKLSVKETHLVSARIYAKDEHGFFIRGGACSEDQYINEYPI